MNFTIPLVFAIILLTSLTGCNTTTYLAHAAKKTGDAYCDTDPVTRAANRAFLREAMAPNSLVMNCAKDEAAARLTQ